MASYARAVVKYAPCGETLLQSVKRMEKEARDTTTAEFQLQQVCESFQGTSTPMTHQSAMAATAKTVSAMARIIVTKTKRLKQHARRSRARKEKGQTASTATVDSVSRSAPTVQAEWPGELQKQASNISNWSDSVFVHLAALTIKHTLSLQGVTVEMKDGILLQSAKAGLKRLLRDNARVIGVGKLKTG